MQTLFDEGKLPYVSIGEFDAMVTNQGGCDSFGYGTADLVLYPVYIYTVMSEGIQFYTNVLDWTSVQKDSNDVLQGVKIYDKNTYQELVGWYVKYDTSLGLYYIYNQEDEMADADVGDGYMPDSSDTVTSPTGGEFQSTTYFKVPKKLGRVLVRSQKPTADNDYTWFNLYSDGWCEQGGFSSSADWMNISVSLPIEMSDVNYTPIITTIRNLTPDSSDGQNEVRTISTTGFVASSGVGNSTTISWQVSGYAAPAEYTRDKWDYQNIKVERPMIQLFNGSTDTALATCTSVLADVSTLKDSLSTLKFKKVEALPDNPDTDTVYFII